MAVVLTLSLYRQFHSSVSHSESRLHLWDLSKPDPCTRADKLFGGETAAGATEGGLQRLALDVTAQEGCEQILKRKKKDKNDQKYMMYKKRLKGREGKEVGGKTLEKRKKR